MHLRDYQKIDTQKCQVYSTKIRWTWSQLLNGQGEESAIAQQLIVPIDEMPRAEDAINVWKQFYRMILKVL